MAMYKDRNKYKFRIDPDVQKKSDFLLLSDSERRVCKVQLENKAKWLSGRDSSIFRLESCNLCNKRTL